MADHEAVERIGRGRRNPKSKLCSVDAYWVAVKELDVSYHVMGI